MFNLPLSAKIILFLSDFSTEGKQLAIILLVATLQSLISSLQAEVLLLFLLMLSR